MTENGSYVIYALWNATFGRSRDYDRFEGATRLQEIASREGAAFIDTTPAIVGEVRRPHRWLHYRIDEHPTAEGQRVIAEAVAEFLQHHAELLDGVRH